eukprot:70986-Rhodomonas_salina.5
MHSRQRHKESASQTAEQEPAKSQSRSRRGERLYPCWCTAIRRSRSLEHHPLSQYRTPHSTHIGCERPTLSQYWTTHSTRAG